MKILITEFMEAKSVKMLNRNFDVTVDKSLSLNHNELKKIISNFDILIVRNKTQVNKESELLITYSATESAFIPVAGRT